MGMKSLGLVCLLAVTASAHPVRQGDVGGRRRPPPPDLEEVVPPPPPVATTDVMIDHRAEITEAGESIRLDMVSGGKKPGVRLEAKNASINLFDGEAIGTLKSAHGTT